MNDLNHVVYLPLEDVHACLEIEKEILNDILTFQREPLPNFEEIQKEAIQTYIERFRVGYLREFFDDENILDILWKMANFQNAQFRIFYNPNFKSPSQVHFDLTTRAFVKETFFEEASSVFRQNGNIMSKCIDYINIHRAGFQRKKHETQQARTALELAHYFYVILDTFVEKYKNLFDLIKLDVYQMVPHFHDFLLKSYLRYASFPSGLPSHMNQFAPYGSDHKKHQICGGITLNLLGYDSLYRNSCGRKILNECKFCLKPHSHCQNLVLHQNTILRRSSNGNNFW